MTTIEAPVKAKRLLTRIERKTLRDIRWHLDAARASASPEVRSAMPDSLRGRAVINTRSFVERLFVETRMPKARIRKAMQPLLDSLTEQGVLIPMDSRDWMFYADEDAFDSAYPDGSR